MGEMGNRNRDVGRDGLHIHNSVRNARLAPRLAETVRRCGHQGHRQERALVVTSDERLRSILEMLEFCRAGLLSGGNSDSAHLVSVAILDVKMRLHRIGDAEFRALCDEMLADRGSPGERDATLEPGGKRRPLLRLVK
jgi:hypothetical protein